MQIHYKNRFAIAYRYAIWIICSHGTFTLESRKGNFQIKSKAYSELQNNTGLLEKMPFSLTKIDIFFRKMALLLDK